MTPPRADRKTLTAYRKLVRWMQSFDRILVAYSGGVDSTVVLAAAAEAARQNEVSLETVVPVMCVSPSHTTREHNEGLEIARALGFDVLRMDSDECSLPEYIANGPDRCYYCKRYLMSELVTLAKELDCEVIVTGDNASDLLDHRPGRQALEELGIRSPLAELGITKGQVRIIARDVCNLPSWDRPARACLATRIPAGTEISVPLLEQVGMAEDSLISLGLRQFRVRHYGMLAQLELDEEEMPWLLEHRIDVVEALKDAGYEQVCLDLQPLKRL